MKQKMPFIYSAILILILSACSTTKNNLSSETSLRNAAMKWQNAIDA